MKHSKSTQVKSIIIFTALAIGAPAFATSVSCPELFGSPSLNELAVQRAPHAMSSTAAASAGLFKDRNEASAFVRDLTRADIADTREFNLKLNEFGRRLGLKPEETVQLAESYLTTGLIGGDLHIRSFLLSQELVKDWNGVLGNSFDQKTLKQMADRNFELLDSGVSRKKFDSANEAILLAHTEYEWARVAAQRARAMAIVTHAMIDKSYPRTVSVVEKAAYFKKRLGARLKADEIVRFDHIIDSMESWKGEAVLEMFFKATMGSVAEKVSANADGFFERFINKIAVISYGPAIFAAGVDIVGDHLIGLPMLLAGGIGVFASASFVATDPKTHKRISTYEDIPKFLKPATLAKSTIKSMAVWTDSKFFSKSLRQILLGTRASGLKALPASVSARGVVLRRSTYDVSRGWDQQSLSLQALTGITAVTDERNPDSAAFDDFIEHHDPVMVESEIKAKRNELTIAVEFAEKTLTEQLDRLTEMSLKLNELRQAPLDGKGETAMKPTLVQRLLPGRVQPVSVEAAMSDNEKLKVLVVQISSQRDDIRLSLKVLRMQIAKLKDLVAKFDLPAMKSVPDADIFRLEIFSLQNAAQKLYAAKLNDVSSRAP